MPDRQAVDPKVTGSEVGERNTSPRMWGSVSPGSRASPGRRSSTRVQERPRLEPGEMHAQAHVRTVREGDVGDRGPEDVERLGIVPAGLVVVGRADVRGDALSRADGDARQLHLAGGGAVDRQQRRLAPQPLLDRLGEQGAVGGHGGQLIGMGEQEIEQVARRTVGRLGPGREKESQEGVDRLVGQLLAVHLGRDEVADDVFCRPSPAVGHDAGEVLAQRFGGGQPAVDVGHQPDELDGPALELGEVLLGEAEEARDHPHGELEGELAHQVRLAVGCEAVNQLVDDRTDVLGLPARQRLLPECVRHQVPVAAVLGVVHAQDHVAHDHADGDVVARRRERLGVAQDPRAVVVAVGDPSRFDVDALGERLGGDGETFDDRSVAALGDEAGIGVPGGAGDDVVECGERVVFLGVGCDHGATPSLRARPLRWCQATGHGRLAHLGARVRRPPGRRPH